MPGGKWLLPLVAPLTLWPTFRRAVVAGEVRRAWLAGMAWAGLLSLGVIAVTELLPAAAGAGILNGEPYRREMFGWIATGQGMENEPSRFIPQHLLHLGAFVVLTALSGGYLGLALGAALTGYMSYFVGSYALASNQPVVGALVAWVPWSVVRVAAFVLLGVLLARPVLARRAWPFSRADRLPLALGIAGIGVDLLLKSFAAPGYGRFLADLAVRAGGAIAGS